jgi:hypothetical protein
MSLEVTAALASGVAGASGFGGSGVQAGYGAGFAPAANGFQAALRAAEPTAGGSPDAIGQALKGVMTTLEGVNGQASNLAAHARAAEAAGGMSPGEMIMMTVRCHAFLFNCQLTSNIANRTSDGLLQLYRQQG